MDAPTKPRCALDSQQTIDGTEAITSEPSRSFMHENAAAQPGIPMAAAALLVH
jgi:hypothetical protein